MKYNKIDKKLFIENRKNLVEKLKPGSIALVFANHQMPRNGDQYFPYRQNSDFFYLTGIEQEKSILLLAPDAKQNSFREILFVLKSSKILETWEGHKLSFEEAGDISGIQNIQYETNFISVLHSLISETENIYFNIPELAKFDPEIKSRDQKFFHLLESKYPLHKKERLSPIMQQLRLKKSPIEIELLRKASEITHEAFLVLLQELKPGMKEYEIEALITYIFQKYGSSGHAYLPIIASGKNACILHYVENNQTCNSNELLLLDFGSEYSNYAADLSRTIPVNGKYTPRQKQVYEACLKAFKYARSLMKPGTSINEIHTAVCKMLEEEHIQLGLYTRKQAEEYKGEQGLWFEYYMHGTSHFLGLDVHDVGTKETLLEPGMVITCEPGIYINNESVGIRIENDILITESSNIDLMEKIPIEVEEIESLMRKN